MFFKKILSSFGNFYLLWFDSMTEKNSLLFSQKVLILLGIFSGLYFITYITIGLNIFFAIITDIAMRNLYLRKKLYHGLKKNSSPEIFEIFGNPGEAALAKTAGKVLTGPTAKAAFKVVGFGLTLDHLASETGLYKVIETKHMEHAVSDPEIRKHVIKEVWSKPRTSIVKSALNFNNNNDE